MKVNPNKVVAVTYELSLPDQEGEFDVVEVVDEKDPMYFIMGHSGLPEQFEEELTGLVAGDQFEFTLQAEKGYGEVDPDAVVTLPKNMFEEEGVNTEELLVLGNIIHMTNEDGHNLSGQVIDIQEETVILDFNHPLAGKEMHFSGKVIEVREATTSELDHGHVHGTGGVHH